MKTFMKKLLIPVIALMLCVPMMTMAADDESVLAQTYYKANDLLTRSISSSDILKWTVRTVFDHTVTFNDTVKVYGDAWFYNPVVIESGLNTKNLTVTGDSNLGDVSLDETIIAGKIARPGGPIWIYDDLRVQGDLELKTASIGSGEIADGTITAADLEEVYQDAYATTIVVSPVGTDKQNGINLQNIIGSITDNSASKPYLLKLEPGTYDIGGGSLIMKPYVDIEGSGQDLTVIKSKTDGSFTNGIIIGSANAEIRNLTALGVSETGNLMGIVLASGQDLSLRDVTISLQDSDAVSYGIKCGSANPILNNVTIDIDGSSGSHASGLYLPGCTPIIRNVDITAQDATTNYGIETGTSLKIFDSSILASGGGMSHGLTGSSNPSIINSTIQGTGGTTSAYGISASSGVMIDHSFIQGDDAAWNSSNVVAAGATMIGGGVAGGGTFICASSFTDSYAAVNASCL